MSSGHRPTFAEFRSDTFTMPDQAMREAIREAKVGNSGYGEDPSVNELERKVAAFFGREAGLFLPSATMAGQIAIRVWTRPGDVVIIDEYGHNYYFETGAMAAIAGAQARLLRTRNGILEPEDIAGVIRHPENPHARTALVVLENTSNFGGGTIYPQATLDAIFALAEASDLPVHVDGARIWNALVASGADPKRVLPPGGSMSVCFSKGLGAPMGALLLGESGFIGEARRVQQMLGGVMRQVGFMAAAALHGFEHNFERLAEDHDNARFLAERIANVDGIDVDLAAVHTNIVYADVAEGSQAASDIIGRLESEGVRALNVGRRLRFVTSMLVDRRDCENAADALGRAGQA